MQCPIDQANLVMSERKGVEIDYCPQCRGVWLDRGELDKIIDRSIDAEIAAENTRRPLAPAAVPAAAPAPPAAPVAPARYGHDGHHGDHAYDPRYDKRKRKESWLGELFDF
ncbi:zf-TFIIB domain-containing protein [Myceligenerans cantabricum]